MIAIMDHCQAWLQGGSPLMPVKKPTELWASDETLLSLCGLFDARASTSMPKWVLRMDGMSQHALTTCSFGWEVVSLAGSRRR